MSNTRCFTPAMLVSVLLAAAFTATSSAQQTQLVTVDVWVVDEQDNPVTGLGANDFEVLHDGRPMSPTRFVEVRDGAPVGAGEDRSAAPSGQGPGYVILFIDQSTLQPGSYEPMIEGVEALLETDGVEAARVLVLSQGRELSMLVPFGSSKPEILEAVGELAREPAIGLDREKEEELAVESIRQAWFQTQNSGGSAQPAAAGVPAGSGLPGEVGGSPRSVVEGAGGPPGGGGGPEACSPFLDQIRPILDVSTRIQGRRIAVTLESLATTAGFVAGLPGVKTLLYFGDRLETRPGEAMANYALSFCPAAAADLLTEAMAKELTRLFEELTRSANSNRVTIHSVHTATLRGPRVASASGSGARGDGGGRSRRGFESSRSRTERDGLILLAEQTGGRAVFDKRELGPALSRIGRESDTYYSLAIEPPPGTEQGGHAIEVRLRDATVTPRYRRGYLDKDRQRRLAERVSGALNLGITDNSMGVRLGVGAAQEGEAGSLRLPLFVMVPVERLAFVPGEGAPTAEVDVQVMARKMGGGDLVTREQSSRVQGSEEMSGYAKLTLVLELDQGTYLSGVGVADAATGDSSFVSTVLEASPEG